MSAKSIVPIEIGTWIGLVENVLGKTKYDVSTDEAKKQLQEILSVLKLTTGFIFKSSAEVDIVQKHMDQIQICTGKLAGVIRDNIGVECIKVLKQFKERLSTHIILTKEEKKYYHALINQQIVNIDIFVAGGPSTDLSTLVDSRVLLSECLESLN